MTDMKIKIENKHVQRYTLPILVSFLWGMMTACSGNDIQLSNQNGQELVLYAFLKELSGEASFSNPVFFAKGNESRKYTEIWKASVKPDGSTDMAGPKYYPSDDSRIYLCGFAPEGKQDSAGKRKYSVDGQQDILVSNEQSGSLTDMFWREEKSFEFLHLLTQLRFRLCCDAVGEAQGWKLRSLVAEGMQQEAVLSLVDKRLLFSGERGMVVVVDRMKEEERLSLTTTWTDIGKVTMIQSGIAVNLTITIEDKDGNLECFEHLPVTFHEDDKLSVAGTSYLLSVRLRVKDEASLSVAIAPWKTGDSGNGTITEE